jgi:predicted dinucleotide-utilizing enzyme
MDDAAVHEEIGLVVECAGAVEACHAEGGVSGDEVLVRAVGGLERGLADRTEDGASVCRCVCS